MPPRLRLDDVDSEWVPKLQEALANWDPKFYVGQVGGSVYDGITREAVRDFQGHYGLHADGEGECGPEVWYRLGLTPTYDPDTP